MQLSAAELAELDPQFGLHKAGARSPFTRYGRKLFQNPCRKFASCGEGVAVAVAIVLLIALLLQFPNPFGQGNHTADYVQQCLLAVLQL